MTAATTLCFWAEMQHFPVRCAAMTGPLRSSPSAAARLERSSRVVLHATNASNRRIRASLPISSALLPDLRAGDFSICAMAEPEGGTFPVSTSARKAIMEKRPNEYSDLQPEGGCALSNYNGTPRGSWLPPGNLSATRTDGGPGFATTTLPPAAARSGMALTAPAGVIGWARSVQRSRPASPLGAGVS